MENELSFYLGSPTSVQNTYFGKETILLAWSPSTPLIASSCTFYTPINPSLMTHPLHRMPFHKNLRSGISQFIMPCLPTMIIGDQWYLHAMPTTECSGMNEFCHAMPSITEFVLSEWRSMLSSDISDLKFWIRTFYMQQSLVHHATPLRPYVHQPLAYMQVLYFLFFPGIKKTWD